MSTMFWVWVTAAVIFLILELMTPTFVFACFVVGSITAGVYSYFYPESYYWQVGIFIVLTVGLRPLTRTSLMCERPDPGEAGRISGDEEADADKQGDDTGDCFFMRGHRLFLVPFGLFVLELIRYGRFFIFK